MALGETLIQQGAITPDQLNKALEIQKKTPGKKLGEIMIEMGFINQEQLSKAL